MVSQKSGFREIEHTADWQLEVWAPDLPALLEQAARGMYAISGVRLRNGPRQARSVELPADDPERLLVRFLSELLYFGEQENLAFDRFHLMLSGDSLQAYLEGAPIDALEKQIKAVTYHNLHIRSTERGLEARVVFDV